MIICVILALCGTLVGVQAGKLPGSPDVNPYCGPCNVRRCPYVDAETCPGRVVKDHCGCCPICEQATIKPATTPSLVEPQSTGK